MHPDSRSDSILSWAAMVNDPGGTHTTRSCLVHPDGTERWTECIYINRLDPDDGSGDVLLIAFDITKRRVDEAEIRRLGLEFRILAEQVPSAVFRADLQGAVTFGNTPWDELAGPSGAAQDLRLVAHADDQSIVDDEFVILAYDIDTAGEASLHARLAASLIEPVIWPGGSWMPSASMGTTRASAEDDVASLVRRADQAMFDGKRLRRLEHR